MKKLLKSSTSSLVLMTLLASSHTAYGGNGVSSHKSQNNNSTETKLTTTTPRIKTGSSELDFVLNEDENHPVGKEIKALDNESFQKYLKDTLPLNISRLPHNDLLWLIFSHMSPQDFPAIELTCKHWLHLSLAYTDYLQKQSQFVAKLAFSNPRNFIWAYNKLAQGFPIENYPKVLLPQDPNKTTTDVTPEMEIPEEFTALTESVKEFAPYKQNLAKNYIRLDPFDRKAVGFAASVVKASPELQNTLKLVVKSTQFNYETIGGLMTMPQEHKKMQFHLMALKLLALGGDLESQTALSNFNLKLPNAFPHDKAFKNNYSQLKSAFAYTVDQPLWSLYGDNELSLSTQTNFLTSCLNSYLNTRKNKPNVDNLIKLREYTLTFFPQTKYISTSQYTNVLSNFYEIEGNIEQQVKTLTQGAQQEDDLYYLMNIAGDLIDEEAYSDGLKYLELSLEKAKNSSLHFEIKRSIAAAILESGDTTQFVRAHTYLSEIFKEFETQKKKKEIKIHYQSEASSTDITIAKDDLLELQSALYIYQGNFEMAAQCLQQMKGPQLDISTLNAIHTQLTQGVEIPSNLLKILRKNFQYITNQLYKHREEISKNLGFRVKLYDVITHKYPQVTSLLTADQPTLQKNIEKLKEDFSPSKKEEKK